MRDPGAILPLRTTTHTVSMGVGLATWLAGLAAVYVAQPLAVGRGLSGAFLALEPGSHVGNLVAGGIFTFWVGLVLFVVRGSRLSAPSSILAAHGLIGIGVFYAALVMAMGMSDVVDYGEESPAVGGPAIALAVSGGIALVLLFGILVGRRVAERLGRAGATAPKQAPR